MLWERIAAEDLANLVELDPDMDLDDDGYDACEKCGCCGWYHQVIGGYVTAFECQECGHVMPIE